MCLSSFVRLDCYLVANTLLPFNASSISLDFVHPVNEQSKLSLLYALSLMEIQIRILSSFFLFIIVFFVRLVCCLRLMLFLCAVWKKCVNSHTTTCLVFMLGAFRSQFFLFVWIIMRRLPLHCLYRLVPHDFLHHRGIFHMTHVCHRAIHSHISYLQSLMDTLYTHCSNLPIPPWS